MMDNKIISASYKATKTNESCMLFNKSEDYSTMVFISIAAIIRLIYLCVSGKFERIPYSIATIICCFILIYVMHKCKQNKINKFIKNNKSNFIYRIDGRIYEFACESQKEYYQIKNKEYSFIVLTNQFSVNEYGVAYVIRKKSTLSAPDAKIYIDKSYSEEIKIFYDMITEIKTEKILTAAELKRFLKAEESN